MIKKAAQWLPTCQLAHLQTGIGLLIFFALALHTAVHTSPTVDESVHILRGQVLWQTGQLRFQAKHAPLTHWLNGSLLFAEPSLPNVTELPSWLQDDRPALAREFLWDYEPQPNIDRIFLLARLPIIWLGVFLGAVLARWARTLAGGRGQAVVLLLFAFSPNLLANFSLATTDGPLAALFVVTVFAWRRYWERPSFPRWLLAGTALGLALGSKLTAILLLPILFILSYSNWRRGHSWKRPGLLWLSLLPLAGIVFWALYGFELRPLPGIPFPVPAATYVNSFLKLENDVGVRYNAYLFGETSRSGWLHYFIVAILIKTPIPTLLFAGTAVFLIFRRKQWRETAPLWFPATIVFAFASYSRLNIGYRHILPLLPFALLLAATAARRPKSNLRSSRLSASYLIPLLLVWYVISSLRQHPHHLAYFNELGGGSSQGYHYLADSNIDWGQSLKFLADYVNESGVNPVFVSYAGAAEPAYYGLQSPPLFDMETGQPAFARANPALGRYAISVNHVLGHVLTETDMFAWFRRQKPTDNVGYSILIYDVPEAAAGSWIAHCVAPAPLLSQEEAIQLTGQDEARHVYFDCRTSWVFPNDGRPGWYILPQQDSWPVAEHFPEHLQPVYAHDASSLEPSYAVWYWDGKMDLTAWTAVTNDPTPLFGQTANLMGYTTNQSEWWTIWQVKRTPIAPLTVAAHLYGEGSPPIVADGLGYTSEQWQPGDWFVQLHEFEGGTDGRYLETGLYNYLTGERLAEFIQLPAK
ncbi:MAG: glycosyltransferase family 39 protein [Chloroflexi bacterium]|nr:glycosyltransferase family 39 protein [Chloroflexota bacterium]